MKAKNTTEMGKEFEKFIEKNFAFDNSHRSASSGASFHDNIDITSDSFVIECESTEKKSYSLKLSFWEEVRGKAYNSKKPLIAFRFRNIENPRKSVDLIALDVNDFLELVEKAKSNEKKEEQ
jgi:hypothetical protein